ncbi:DUF4126 domain-containing protein [Allostreptomyces psammosilenae]|uniref:DUF4126 domain-containing protein n=1 Tax=Allostreptomyces psammosilenae TaxID=1892865 RepID=A0A853A2G6_9ACTN|nr:DUF4126 domain-containing protein [Allostreptomyces psammosilenae]NYI07074.1 hypothetical protein [Allostreptomyces psammosilenae]
MDLVPLVFTSGWASGINAYAVVLLLGLMGRVGWADATPDALQRTDVLIVATVLFLIELVADKIPYVDSVWDALHTVIRPVAGATVAALIAGQDGSLGEIAAGTVGGVTALVSHLIKASARMAVNSSPEPASNMVVSAAEDVTVAGVIVLAIVYPTAAAVVAAVLLVAGGLVLFFLASRIRRFWGILRERRAQRALARTAAPAPTPGGAGPSGR